MGADPELFIETNGAIVGSEKLVPETGIDSGSGGKTVRDGVQIEIHPTPAHCRAYFTNNLSYCFKALVKQIRATDEKANLNFSSVVKLSKEEMASLSEQSKVFGCMPSNNVYDQEQSKIKVNPKRYLKRSAGGHIHLSSSHGDANVTNMLRNPNPMIPVLDIILGNTSVLIDRNPANKERRKVYGKAGEHRIKPYGCEYRTLSNFWLQSVPLASMVMGLARYACNIVQQTNQVSKTTDYVGTLFSLVKQDNIVKAIQENDFDLAMENFLKLKEFFSLTTQSNCHNYPINYNNIPDFLHFVEKGMSYWWNNNPIHEWTVAYTEGHGLGFESFLQNRVRKDRLDNKPSLPDKTCKEIWIG